MNLFELVDWLVRTFSIGAIGGILGQSAQIVAEKHLVARHPLDRRQHVVLQAQLATLRRLLS